MTETREQFRDNLRRLIEKRQCMQADIARYTGCSEQTVSAWLKGRGYPRADTMAKIAKYFGVPVFELVCEDNSEEERLLRDFRVLSAKGREKALERLQELKSLYFYE